MNTQTENDDHICLMFVLVTDLLCFSFFGLPRVFGSLSSVSEASRAQRSERGAAG